jgi:hypothetical protein
MRYVKVVNIANLGLFITITLKTCIMVGCKAIYYRNFGQYLIFK